MLSAGINHVGQVVKKIVPQKCVANEPEVTSQVTLKVALPSCRSIVSRHKLPLESCVTCHIVKELCHTLQTVKSLWQVVLERTSHGVVPSIICSTKFVKESLSYPDKNRCRIKCTKLSCQRLLQKACCIYCRKSQSAENFNL